MFARQGDDLLVVVNAACKDADLARMQTLDLEVTALEDRALLALQGPEAEAVLARVAGGVAGTKFMDLFELEGGAAGCWATRSGYTGEDGFEISVPADQAAALARDILAQPEAAAIGLGARDSLRLEAGLCLYGHDIDASTTGAEGALGWAVQKARRSEGARAGGFPGAEHLLAKPARRRVGLLPEGRAPMREGVQLFDAQGGAAGHVTSGGFGPSVGGPIAMGYVNIDHTAAGTELLGEVRGKRMPVTVAALPFVPANFKR